jgi:hypothetical protein
MIIFSLANGAQDKKRELSVNKIVTFPKQLPCHIPSIQIQPAR